MIAAGAMHIFFSKGFPEAEEPLRAWVEYLEDEALYGPDDPLFLAPAIAPQANTGLKAEGFTPCPKHAATST